MPAISGEELAREFYRALAQGDRDALGSLLHPELSGQTAEGLPLGLGGVYDGADAMLRGFYARLARHFEARAEPDGFHPLGDGQLLVTGRYLGRGRQSGNPLDASFAHVLSVTDGQITRIVQYTDTQRWHDALGGARPLSAVDYDVADGVATIRLNRPEAGNAIDATMAAELGEVATRCAENERVRAVLLCGAGPNFTLGGDLALLAGLDAEQRAATLRRMTDGYHLALRRLATSDAPVVCAVRGAAAGGGLGLALCADIVVAAADSTFVLGYGKLGLTADGGTTWFLPRIVGPRRAAQMFLQHRKLTGTEAADWGIVSELAEADTVEHRAHEIASGLAQGPTAASGQIRRLLGQSLSSSLDDQLAAEQRSMVASAATADADEGLAAFAAKRRPQFSGE